MWPDDYITWAQMLYPPAYRIARGALLLRNNDPHFQADIPGLAHQARQWTFELAQRHLPSAGYFADFNAFRFWIMAVVAHETIRLYLLHAATQLRLDGLPSLERRLLGLVYVDHLTDSEVATLLGIPAGRCASERRRRLQLSNSFPL
jgi:hypothetical protein